MKEFHRFFAPRYFFAHANPMPPASPMPQGPSELPLVPPPALWYAVISAGPPGPPAGRKFLERRGAGLEFPHTFRFRPPHHPTPFHRRMPYASLRHTRLLVFLMGVRPPKS